MTYNPYKIPASNKTKIIVVIGHLLETGTGPLIGLMDCEPVLATIDTTLISSESVFTTKSKVLSGLKTFTVMAGITTVPVSHTDKI